VSRSSSISYVLPLVVSLGSLACSSSGDAPQSANGGHGSGGVTSSGGETGRGGAGSGGAAGSTQTGEGGRSSTGGSLGTGGRSGTGGTSSAPTGGVTGTGGATGKGGMTTSAGGGGGTSAAGAGGAAGSTGAGGSGPGSGGRSGPDAGRDGGPAGTGGNAGGGAGGRPNADAAPSAGGAGGGYNPCKASPCKILPLGDSITQGVNSTDLGGYRSPLFKLAVAANQNITFTGTQMGGPTTVSGKTFPRNHEGYSGYTVESGYSTYGTPGISDKIPSPAFNTMPDIVLLHIGTNDLTSSNAKSTVADRLDKLLTKIVGVAPDALIVVAKVIPLGYTSSDWDTYNSKIPGLVQTHAGKGEHMIMVDMSKLPSNQLSGVHPTDTGYATMASYWYDGIKAFLPN
jgi:lysophospholipase L1-like esterase